MYLYLDESGVDGNSEYICVCGILCDIIPLKNIVTSKLRKYIRNFNSKSEVKFTNQNISKKVYKKDVVLNVVYDKVSLKIDKKTIQKYLTKDIRPLSKVFPHATLN